MQWETEVLPVLNAVHSVLAESSFPVNGAERNKIEEKLGRDPWDPRTGFALIRLAEAGYLRKLIRD